MPAGNIVVNPSELARQFECCGESLLGICHRPENSADTGLVIVVGGPQYRVGSHRQFLLLARSLAQHNFPVFRFDYRAMGDSQGSDVNFEDVEEDIRAAIDDFFQCCPQLKQVVLWGLCDAASASLFYAANDDRVTGLVLLNPWVRTEAGEAKAYVKHYYIKRIIQPHFWKKVLTGGWNPFVSLGSFLGLLKRGIFTQSKNEFPESDQESLDLRGRMLYGWERFSGKVLLVLSGHDYVADEFRDLVNDSQRWQRLVNGDSTQRFDIPEANHTFSTAQWREQVEQETLRWLKSEIQTKN